MSEIPKINPEAEKKEEKILHNVVFGEVVNVGKGEVEYRSKSLDRKIAVLKKGVKKVPVGKMIYAVKVVEDTNPSDPKTGKYIVEIIYDSQTEGRLKNLAESAQNFFGRGNFEQAFKTLKKIERVSGASEFPSIERAHEIFGEADFFGIYEAKIFAGAKEFPGKVMEAIEDKWYEKMEELNLNELKLRILAERGFTAILRYPQFFSQKTNKVMPFSIKNLSNADEGILIARGPGTNLAELPESHEYWTKGVDMGWSFVYNRPGGIIINDSSYFRSAVSDLIRISGLDIDPNKFRLRSLPEIVYDEMIIKRARNFSILSEIYTEISADGFSDKDETYVSLGINFNDNRKSFVVVGLLKETMKTMTRRPKYTLTI